MIGLALLREVRGDPEGVKEVKRAGRAGKKEEVEEEAAKRTMVSSRNPDPNTHTRNLVTELTLVGRKCWFLAQQC